MAKFRQISPKIWNDTKFRSLSDNGKLVFFMLLTHPHTSAIGTLRAYFQGLAAELGWTLKAFQEAFQEASSKGMAKADQRAGLIWLPNFIKYNLPQSPNVLKSWVGSFDDCPECALKNQVYQSIKSLSESLSKAFGKAFREAFRDPLPNQEQEQEQDIGTGTEDLSSVKKDGLENQKISLEPEDEKMPDKSGSSEIVKTLDEKYLNFARRYQNEVRINLGNAAPNPTEQLISAGAIELEKATRIDCFDWNELVGALIWATQDDFWRQNLRSLASMRKKTRNGVTKIQEIVGRYRAAQGNPGRSMGQRHPARYNPADRTSYVVEESRRICQEILEEDRLKQEMENGAAN